MNPVRFEWHAHKAAANLRKHGVPFDEASTVFDDPLSATGADLEHSAREQRYITFGLSSRGRLLAVAHTDRGDSARIISARLATPVEKRIYEEG